MSSITPDYVFKGKDDHCMSWNKWTRALSADCSDVFGRGWQNFAYIAVAATGNTRRFEHTHTQRDSENDVIYYVYTNVDDPTITLHLFND